MFTQTVLAIVLLSHASIAWVIPFLSLQGTVPPMSGQG